MRIRLTVVKRTLVGLILAGSVGCGSPPARQIHLAAHMGYEQFVTEVLEKDPALVNARDPGPPVIDISGKAGPQYEGAPLHTAAKSGHLDVVKLLVERGAALDGAGIGDRTPLHAAARHPEIASYLLEQGAPIDFYAAIALGRLELVREYLDTQPDRARTPDAIYEAAHAVKQRSRDCSSNMEPIRVLRRGSRIP